MTVLKVASVFYIYDLYDDMYLQSDATLAYSLMARKLPERTQLNDKRPITHMRLRAWHYIAPRLYYSIKAAMDPAATSVATSGLPRTTRDLRDIASRTSDRLWARANRK